MIRRHVAALRAAGERGCRRDDDRRRDHLGKDESRSDRKTDYDASG